MKDTDSLIAFCKKTRKDLNISRDDLFEEAIIKCNGAPKEFNCESMTDFHNRQQSIRSINKGDTETWRIELLKQ